MAADRPTREPASIQAGVTLLYDRSFYDFPAADWTLTYSLRSADFAPIDFTANANGNDFRVEVTASTTSTWNPGRYLMIGRVTDGSETHQVYRGYVEVLQDFVAEGAVDVRTYNEKMLDKIEATLEGRIARDDVSYSINGRTFTFKNDDDLLKMRDYFRQQVYYERRGGRPKHLLVKFVKPS